MVYVINKHNKPLMPTERHGHVRKLLKAGLAVPVCNNPFTIKLKYETPDIVQDLYLGVDVGRENIGTGVSDRDGKCVFLSELKTNNKSVKKNMDDRRGYRGQRRHNGRLKKQRKAIRDNTDFKTGDDDSIRHTKECKSREISYPKMDGSITCKAIRGVEAQFANRKRCEGWQTPSGRQLIQMHFHAIEPVMKILPISHITVEGNVFDFQKLENADIRAWEYTRGPLYGYSSYKDYIYEQQSGKCLLCGNDKIEYYHHIKPRAEGGSDNVRNIAGLCDGCHNGVAGVHKSQDTCERLAELKEGMAKKYTVSLLNSIMPELVEEFDSFCKRKGISFSLTDGKETAACREKYGIPKKHCTDGYAISLSGREIPAGSCNLDGAVVYIQQRYKKKSAANIHKLNQREYYAVVDGKRVLVAKNRHKAEGQKDDSLEEYMVRYADTHTAEECTAHLKSLTVKPAKRTYLSHRDGKWCDIHVGDVVLYEKHNKIKGNTKKMVFVATGMDIANGYVRSGTKGRNSKFCRILSSSCTPFIGKMTL